MRYGGFWLRFFACIFDGLVIFAAHLALKSFSDDGVGFFTDAVKYVNNTPHHYTQNTWAGAIFTWLYFTVLESSGLQATLGKRLFNLKVTDENGKRIGFWRANGRYWSKILSMLILSIGFLMAGFTKHKQGLHDLIARTLVIKRDSVLLEVKPYRQQRLYTESRSTSPAIKSRDSVFSQIGKLHIVLLICISYGTYKWCNEHHCLDQMQHYLEGPASSITTTL